MIIPYRVDVPFDRHPFVNWFLIVAIVLVSLAALGTLLDATDFEQWPFLPYILTGWDLRGLVGHMFIHGGVFHLLGNMLFLWVFGNAVCAKVGNLSYPAVFVFLGLLGAVAHLVFDGGPAVGASGAINGVVAMYLVFFPLNDVSVIYWFGWLFHGTKSLSGFWLVLLWLLFDIGGLLIGGGRVAYHAHLDGFAAGFALAFGLVWMGIVKMDRSERSLVEIFGLAKKAGGKRRPAPAGWEWRGSHGAPSARSRPAPPVAASPFAPPSPYSPSKAQDRPPSPSWPTEAQYRPPRPPLLQPHASQAEAVRFRCPCGKVLKAPAEHAGRRAQCPGCSRVFAIPAPRGAP